MKASVRPYVAQDLGPVLRLWQPASLPATDRATTDDFLAAIAATRPTVTEDMAAAFRADADQFTRY